MSGRDVDAMYARYRQAVTPKLEERLQVVRGWTSEAIARLKLGYDGARVVFPVRDATGELVGFTRYLPNPALRGDDVPKMKADARTPRELFPPPEMLADDDLVDGLLYVVEGEPDGVRLWSVGIPAVAVPGTGCWRREWAPRFARPHLRVVVCFDCDVSGRAAAAQVAADLAAEGIDARLLDLDADRQDGYDVTDFLAKVGKDDGEAAAQLLRRMAELAPAAEPASGADPAPVTGASVEAGRTDAARAAGPVACVETPRTPYDINDVNAEKGGLSRLDRLSRTEKHWQVPRLDPVALYGPAGRWAEAMNPYSEASAVGVLVAELVAFGSAVGRSPYFQVGATRHHLNEFVLLVGPTATARKGEAMRLGMRPVRQADEDWEERVARGFGSGEAVVFAVRDASRGRGDDGDEIELDPGAVDKRTLVQEDELAHVLAVAAREGSTLSPLVRSAWDGNRLENRTKARTLIATDAHLSILSAITPEELRRRVPETEIANGFLNRFCLVAVTRSSVLPDPPPIPGDLESEYVADLQAALTYARREGAGRMTRDEAAAERWAAAYTQELSVDRYGLAGAVCSRAEAHALRLSMLYALLDRSQTIRLEHVEAALALWRYCEASALVVFGDSLGDPVADTILAGLAEAGNGGITRTEIRDLFSRNRSAAEIGPALDQLLDAGLIQVETEQSGGRPVTRYFFAEAPGFGLGNGLA